MATARIASIPDTTLFKNSGNALYISPNQAVAVANPYTGWAQIPTTSADIGDSASAQFLWYLPATNPLLIASGETAYFYRRFTVSFTDPGASITITPSVSIVTDNAFLGRINIISTKPTTTNNPTDLTDGVFTPGESLFETAPYTWQNVSTPSVPAVNLSAAETLVTVEFELEVMNYMASPLGNPQNPAGFEYSVSIAGFPAGSTFTNANNSNPVLPLP